jgi:hypothetical protein
MDHDTPPPINEIGKEQHILHLHTNIFDPEEPPRLSRRRRPDNNKRQRHTEKPILLDLINGEKIKLPI